jgi:hypothetical protein
MFAGADALDDLRPIVNESNGGEARSDEQRESGEGDNPVRYPPCLARHQ